MAFKEENVEIVKAAGMIGVPLNLAALLMSSRVSAAQNEEGESPGQSSEDGDENAPPLQRIPHGMLALSKLDKADSFGFPQSSRAASSPASLHVSTKQLPLLATSPRASVVSMETSKAKESEKRTFLATDTAHKTASSLSLLLQLVWTCMHALSRCFARRAACR